MMSDWVVLKNKKKGWMDLWVVGRMDGWYTRWMGNRWMDEWTDEWTDERKDE